MSPAPTKPAARAAPHPALPAVFKAFCEDTVAGAVRAFNPAGRECLCADPRRVGWACAKDLRPPAQD